jgi:hypothetical protein
MATLTLQSSFRVGDLANGVIVDKLDLVSVSINFQPENKNAIVSVMLRHPASGFIHTVTISGSDGDLQWAAIKAALPAFEKQILTLIAAKLPTGTIA